MLGQGRGSARLLDETAALIFAIMIFLFFLALGFVGRVFAPFSKGPVGWELMTPVTALSVVRSHVSGPQCLTYLQGATVELKGRDADVTIPDLGKVAVQSRLYGEYTIQPLASVRNAEGCFWNPPVPFDWLQE